MSAWRTPIRCYVSASGRNKIAEWYEGLSVQERSDADEFLKNMRRLPPSDWKMEEYRSRLSYIRGVAKAKAQGLGELRWKSENKQHRLLGFFRKGVWYAVLGCTHKQNIYKPADSLANAARRKTEIELGTVETVEYDL